MALTCVAGVADEMLPTPVCSAEPQIPPCRGMPESQTVASSHLMQLAALYGPAGKIDHPERFRALPEPQMHAAGS